MTLDEYLETYGGDSPAPIVITPDPDGSGEWPVVVVKRGDYALVLHLCAHDDTRDGLGHVFVDARAFVRGEEARTGVFGMEQGRRYKLEPTPGTSHTWPATKGVTLLVGRQG